MSEPEATVSTPAPATPDAAKPRRGRGALLALPVLAFFAWVGAMAFAVLFDLNSLEQPMLYGWEAPLWAFFLFPAVSLILGGLALWRKTLPWAYVTILPLLPVGTGNHLILEKDAPALLGFALCLFLVVEYLTAIPRFTSVFASTQTLDKEEAKPVHRYFQRYVVLSLALGIVYAVALLLYLRQLLPSLGSLISERLSDGLENQVAVGITTFTLLIFAVIALLRLTVDGFVQLFVRERKPEEEPEGVPQETVPVGKGAKA